MAITQLQTNRRTPTKLEAGIQKVWLEAVPLLDAIPTVTNGSLQVRHRRQTILPTPSTRKLYGSFSESYGGWQEMGFDLPIYGGLLRIDEQLLSEPGGAEEWADQVTMWNEAFAFQLNNDAINGDRGVSPEAMDGLKAWVTTLPSRQTITPSTPIDLTTSANRKTNGPELIRYMDLAMMRVRQGTGKNPNLIVMDDDMYNLMVDAFRQSTFLSQGTDNQDREFMTFKGARIVLGGFRVAEALSQSTAVVGANHDGNGYTSMYFLRTGPDYVHWIQKHGLKVTQGKQNSNDSTDDGLTLVTKMVEWPIALRVKHPYSVSRLNSLDITP